ncbi:hypothetical protein WH47_11997 [Habropoda laboriosa]|uniref:Histone-lysine N-methyltransferase SETMAR n=1 Tax=Habropoda laboriosa TaxID=597456 RepID=A0A0L7R106_9HYME|nr:hypothetical protein WH47_11997 [Habropoda laboriosa]
MPQKLRIKQTALVSRKVNNYLNLQIRNFTSSDLSLTDYHFSNHLDHFVSEEIFTNQANIENTFEEFIGTRTPIFYENRIKKLVTG